MIFNLISAAAVVNIVLGILALTKGKNKVNLGFFFLSVLLAAWNLCVVMYSGVGIEAAGKFNYMAISLIPAAGLYFVLAVYNMTTGPVTALPKLLLLPASLIIAVSAGSFFLDGLKPFYESTLFRLIIFAHLFIPLLFAFLILIIKYRGLQYKQERIKIGYIIVAFLILFAGGMIDLADGAKIIETKVKFAGNICNVVYATMIFVAIFRMRLFSVEVLFGNFMTYAVMAIAGGSAFLAVASALKEKFQAMAAVFFMMMFVIVYYAGKLKGLAFEFREKIGVVSGAEEARRACNRITISQAEEGIKILDTLLLVEKHLNMSAAVFMRGGDYYMAAWETGGGFYNKLVEGSLVQKDVIVRYEVSEKKQTDLLDRFGADIVVPVIYRDSVIGVLAARKHSSDISMSQDEVDVLVEMASNIAVYMKSKQVQEKQVEDENMRRLGMMAGQMAHEIKNPLTALWGAAQLIEGKDENDRENLGIIKTEMMRLKKILDSWRDYSKELKLDKKRVDAVSLVREAVKLVSLQDQKTDIRVEEITGLSAINADAERIKQVLLNVLLNSVDAASCREKPVITIRMSGTSGYVNIVIRDNGTGIKKEDLARVKEPLFTNKPQGSGLGLAISEKIMKAHDGAIIIDSDGESYTEVSVIIPAFV